MNPHQKLLFPSQFSAKNTILHQPYFNEIKELNQTVKIGYEEEIPLINSQ
jgi:hypothetical protein